MVDHMPDVYLVSFATEDFEPYQRELVRSGKEYGVDKDFAFTKKDLTGTEFYERNKSVFKNARGFGYWLWKPYFILEALGRIGENEIIFYVDAGAKFINDPAALINLARESTTGVVAFNHRPVLTRVFTKRDTFINMHCDSEEYWNADIIMGGIMLLRKNDFTIKFIEEWLKECENLNSLSDLPNINGSDNFPGFIAHREDQSIFSILIKKYQVETFRDPSKWGNFLKMPMYREEGEIVCYPWLLKDSLDGYSDSPDLRSPYPTIFELNRKQNEVTQKRGKGTIYEKIFNKLTFKKSRKEQ
jgi:hypothetical protein